MPLSSFLFVLAFFAGELPAAVQHNAATALAAWNIQSLSVAVGVGGAGLIHLWWWCHWNRRWWWWRCLIYFAAVAAFFCDWQVFVMNLVDDAVASTAAVVDVVN